MSSADDCAAAIVGIMTADAAKAEANKADIAFFFKITSPFIFTPPLFDGGFNDY
jgi:hypothetical protein